jgi:small subunit ribosomal protein S9
LEKEGTPLDMLANRVVVSSGKRKRAIATALIKSGKGRVWVNDVPVEIYSNEMARLKVLEPLLIVGERVRNLVDIRVTVKGGGFMSQAEAARIAIARGLVEFFRCDGEDDCGELSGVSSTLKSLFEEYDRHMLSGDPRRTESEKPMRYSARRRKQRSYR